MLAQRYSKIIPRTCQPGGNTGGQKVLGEKCQISTRVPSAAGTGGWAELESGRDPSKGKKLPDPYGVLPLRDGQDFKRKVTLASHLKHGEGPNSQFPVFQKIIIGAPAGFEGCRRGKEGSAQNQAVTHAEDGQ